MAHVDSQGWETVSNQADVTMQGFVNTMGWQLFSKPSARFAGSRSIQFEDSLAASTDVGPNFAGTTTVQKNTGKLISALWAAGGFAFGAAARFRDLTQQYSYGEFTLAGLSNVGTTGSFSRTMKACFDGTSKYYALRTPVAAATTQQAADAIAVSTDLINWTPTTTTPATSTTLGFFNQISYGNGLLLVSYAQFPGGNFITTHYAVSSDGGATWASKSIPALAGQCFTVSNIVYVASNSTYYVTASFVGDGSHRTFKTTDPVNGTWTQIDALALSGAGGISTCLELIYDANRNVVWQSCGNTQTASVAAARLRSFTVPGEVFTNNWTTTGAGNSAALIPVSVAFSSTIIVAVLMNGTVIRSTNGTTWTAGTGPSAAMSVFYNSTTSQFVLCTNTAGIQVSSDGITWTSITPFGFTSTNNSFRLYNNYISIMNSKIVMFGRSGIYTAPLTNPLAWTEQQRAEIWSNSNSSGNFARASRLGVAAVNSAGRQGFVGYGYNGTMNAATALCFLDPGVASTSSSTVPSVSIATTTAWHYYVLIFTATATPNQFNVTAVIDSQTQPALAANAVQLAPTGDTTSTLYWTVPCRDLNVSVLPSLVEFDDVYIFDNSGTVNNTAMLTCNIVQDHLVSDAQAQWTKNPAGAASNAVAANGLSASASGGSVNSNVVGAKDIYNSDQTVNIASFLVKAVKVEAVLSNTTLAGSSAKVGLASGAASVDTGIINVNTGINTYAAKVQETDPNTSAVWTRANALASQPTLEKVS